MDSYEVMEHTADIGIIAYGKTKDEAFANAAEGMFAQITNLQKVKVDVEITVKLEGEDLESLLVIFLNELLYYFEVKHLLFCSFKVKIDNLSLKATVGGEKIDLYRHAIYREIKAVTFHSLKITHNNYWKIQVLFDI